MSLWERSKVSQRHNGDRAIAAARGLGVGNGRRREGSVGR